MKRFWKSLLVLVMFFALAIPVYAANGKGTGDEHNRVDKEIENVTLTGTPDELYAGDPIYFTATAEKHGQFGEGSMHELVITQGDDEKKRVELDPLSNQDLDEDGNYITEFMFDTTGLAPGDYQATYEITLHSGKSHIYWLGVSESFLFTILDPESGDNDAGGPWIHAHIEGVSTDVKEITLYYGLEKSVVLNLYNNSEQVTSYKVERPDDFVNQDVYIKIDGNNYEPIEPLPKGNGTLNFQFDIE